jgi:cyclopropane fatty-acyl-phospholipid synthase-like methyltransferase
MKDMMNEVPDNWYENFFQGINCEIWENAFSVELTRQEVDFLQSELGLKEGDLVLDMPCGSGRHSIELSKRGFNVTGVDISETFIRAFTKKLNSDKLHGQIIHGDILTITLQNKFSGAICLGNSFGYFDRDGMNVFIEKVSDSLSKGSKYIINSAMIAESILPNFQLYNTNKTYHFGNISMDVNNIYDARKGVMISHLNYTKEGKTEMHSFKHYVYTLAEVSRMLIKHDLQIKGTYNSVSKNEFKLGDQQIYIIAEKC